MWAKLDDRANEHRKQLAAGAEACWLWACGLMYANRQPARDGFIPEAVLPMLYPLTPKSRARLCAKLVEVGLWVQTDGGYQVHEFKQWNKTKEQLETEREGTRLRVAEFRRRNATGNEIGNAVTAPVTRGDVLDPYRSAPLQLPTDPSESSARASEGASDSESDPKLTICPLDLREKAEAVGIIGDFVDKYRVDPEQIREAIREFVSYWSIGGGQGRKQGNWPRKLREHLRRACEKPGGLKPVGEIEHEQHGTGGQSRGVRAAKAAGEAAMALMREAHATGGNSDGLGRKLGQRPGHRSVNQGPRRGLGTAE